MINVQNAKSKLINLLSSNVRKNQLKAIVQLDEFEHQFDDEIAINVNLYSNLKLSNKYNTDNDTTQIGFIKVWYNTKTKQSEIGNIQVLYLDSNENVYSEAWIPFNEVEFDISIDKLYLQSSINDLVDSYFKNYSYTKEFKNKNLSPLNICKSICLS